MDLYFFFYKIYVEISITSLKEELPDIPSFNGSFYIRRLLTL